ncbi:MAG TPA: M56 family metallopeptidase [Pirellulales bacterium]|nr:M56 family metallopeptidase [Pirellulales bacterium]
MNSWIESLNASAAAWAPWLWRICWQGALVIAVAWLITLLLRNRSARLRSWIWRLAYVKLLVLLVWTNPVNLPLLPAAGSGQGPVVSDQQHQVATDDDPSSHKAATDGRAALPIDVANRLQLNDEPSSSRNLSSTATAVIATNTVQPTIPAARLTLSSCLLLAWLLGLALIVGRLAWETWLVLRLRRSARTVHSPQLEALLDQVRQQLSLRCTVQLAESAFAQGPLLVKFFKPCVIFPSGMLKTSPSPLTGEGRGEGDEPAVEPLTLDEIRLILAHELAHLKRHDLAWNALAAISHVLLYFHPAVWLASRRSRQEQELSCDELVVLQMQVAAIDYGLTLIKIVQQIRPTFRTGLVAVGMSGSFKTLSRRIEAMKHIEIFSRRQMLLASFIMATLGVIAIVPWRLTQADPGAPGSSSTSDASPHKAATAGRAEVLQDTANRLRLSDWSQATPAGKSPAEPSSGAPESAGMADPFSGGPGGGAPGAVGAAGMAPNPPNALSEEALAKIKNQLVGRWRNTAGKELEFLKDGGFEDLGAKVRIFEVSDSQNGQRHWVTKYHRGRGHWTIGPDGSLQIIYDEQNVWNADFGLSNVQGLETPSTYIYEIVRLDDSFLRLRNNQSKDTLFFHRVDEKSEAEQLADVPAELRPLLAVAQFTPDEAKQLLSLFEAQQIDPAALKTIGRVLQAYRHQIDLKDLFGMTPDEANAFKELLSESNYRLDAHDLFKLADAGQLSPVEQSGIAKLKAVDAAFDAMVDPNKLGFDIPLGNALMELQFLRGRLDRAGGVRRTMGRNPELTDSQRAALIKLLKTVEELDEWLQYAVFQAQ